MDQIGDDRESINVNETFIFMIGIIFGITLILESRPYLIEKMLGSCATAMTTVWEYRMDSTRGSQLLYTITTHRVDGYLLSGMVPILHYNIFTIFKSFIFFFGVYK